MRYCSTTPTGSCILFGDGCGAIVMTVTDGPCGLLGFDMHSDGNGHKSLNCDFHDLVRREGMQQKCGGQQLRTAANTYGQAVNQVCHCCSIAASHKHNLLWPQACRDVCFDTGLL